MPTPQEKAMEAALAQRAAAAAKANELRAGYNAAAAAQPAPAPAPAAPPAEPAPPAVPDGYVEVAGTQYRTLMGLTSDPVWVNASHEVRKQLFAQWRKQHFDPINALQGDKKTGNPAAAKLDKQKLANWERVHLASPEKKDSWADNDLLDIPVAALANSAGGVLRVVGDLAGSAGTNETGLGLQQWAAKFEAGRLSETTKQKALQEGERATKRLYDALLDNPEWAQKNLSALNKMARPYGGDITKIPVTHPELQALTQQFDREVGLGVWDSAKGAVADIKAQPLNKLAQTVGSMAPALAATALASTAGLGVTAASAVGVGINALMSAGEASGDYDKVMALSHEQLMAGSPEYKAKLAAIPKNDPRAEDQRQVDVQYELALDAQNGGAVGRAAIAAVTGWVGRKVGLDSVISGQAAKLGKRAAAKQVAGSAAEEFAEEAGMAGIGNVAVNAVDANQRLGQGVVAAGVQGAVLGSAMGGIAAKTGSRTPRPLAGAPAANAELAAAEAQQALAAQQQAMTALPGMVPTGVPPSTATLPGMAAPAAPFDPLSGVDPQAFAAAQGGVDTLAGFPQPPAAAAPLGPVAGRTTREALQPQGAGVAAAPAPTEMAGPPPGFDFNNPLGTVTGQSAPVAETEAAPAAEPLPDDYSDPLAAARARAARPAPVAPPPAIEPEDSYSNPILAAAKRAGTQLDVTAAVEANVSQEQEAAATVRAAAAELGLGDVHTPLAVQDAPVLGKASPESLAEAETYIAKQPTAALLFDPTTFPLETQNGPTDADGEPGAAGAAVAPADGARAGDGNAGAGQGAPAAPQGADGAAAGQESAGTARAEPGNAERAAGDGDADGGRAQPAADRAVAAERPAQRPVQEGRGAAGGAGTTAGRQQRSRGTPAPRAADGPAQPDLAGQGRQVAEGDGTAGRAGAAGAEAVAPAPAAPAKPKGGSTLAKGIGSRAVNARVVAAREAVMAAKERLRVAYTPEERASRRTEALAASAELQAARDAQAAFIASPPATKPKGGAAKTQTVPKTDPADLFRTPRQREAAAAAAAAAGATPVKSAPDVFRMRDELDAHAKKGELPPLDLIKAARRVANGATVAHRSADKAAGTLTAYAPELGELIRLVSNLPVGSDKAYQAEVARRAERDAAKDQTDADVGAAFAPAKPAPADAAVTVTEQKSEYDDEPRAPSFTAHTVANADKNNVTAVDQGEGVGYRIITSDVDPAERGLGIGKKLYKQLIDTLLGRGENVESDTTVSQDAVRVYESLTRDGYNVRKHPDAYLVTDAETPYWDVDGETPVFTITSAPVAAQAASLRTASAPALFRAGETLAFSADIKDDIRGVVDGWKSLLGMQDVKLVVATDRGGVELAQSLVGNLTPLESQLLRGRLGASTLGTSGRAMHSPATQTQVIKFRPGLSARKTLEVLGHELGHTLQVHSFNSAPPEVRAAVMSAHRAWLANNKDKNLRDFVKSLRAYGDGDVGDEHTDLTRGLADLSPEKRQYITSFAEWFADNVSKWVTSSAKPRGVVEQFFADLGRKLKEFFLNAPEMHKPDATLAAWLDTLGTTTARGGFDLRPPANDVAGVAVDENRVLDEQTRVAAQTAADSRIPPTIGAALQWAASRFEANDRARTADEYLAQATGKAMPRRSRLAGHNLGGRVLDTFVDTLVKAETAFTDEVRLAEERAETILAQSGAKGATLARYRAAMAPAIAALKESGASIMLEARLFKNKSDAYFRQHSGITRSVEDVIAQTRPEGVAIDAWRARANLYAQALHIRDRHAAKAESLNRDINVAQAALLLEERLRAGGAQGVALHQSMRDTANRLETALGQAFDSPKLSARKAAVESLHAQAVASAQSVSAALSLVTDPAVKVPLRRLLDQHQKVLDRTAKPSHALHAITDLLAVAQALQSLGAKPEQLQAKLDAAKQAQKSYEAANTKAPRRQTNERGEAVDVFDYPLPGGVQLKTAQAVIAAGADQQAGLDAVQRALVEGYRELNALAVQAGKASQQDIDELQTMFPNYVSLSGDSQREVTDTFNSKRRAFIDSSDGATHANQAAMPDENLGHKLKALAVQVGRADLDRMLVAHARLNRTGGPALEVDGVVGPDQLELPQSTIVRLASDYGSEKDRPDDLHTRRIEMPTGAGEVSVETIAIDNPGVADGIFKTPVLESELGRVVAQATRTYGWMVTRFTAAFAPLNMARDMGERLFNIVGLQGKELTPEQVNKVRVHMLRLMKDKQTMLDVKDFAFMGVDKFIEARPDSPLARLAKAGGLTTLTDYMKNEAALDKSILRRDSLPARAWDKLAHGVDVYNTLFETLVPLATFDALQSVAGMSDQKAAGVTARMFDLRARGTVSPHMSALYSFFAPTAYGGAQLWRTLTGEQSGKRAQKELLGGMAAAGMLYMVLRGIDEEDENGQPMLDSQSEALVDGSMPIPLGDGTYFKLPIPFGGPRMAWIAGARTVRVVNGVDSPWEGVAALATEMVKSVMPTGVSQESFADEPSRFLAKTFTPSMVKTVTNLATNTNAFGTPLNYSMREGEYASEQGRYSTPEIYTELATALRVGTGGAMDTTPESMRELLGGVLIGPAAALLTLMASGDKEEKGLATSAMKDGLTGAMVQAVGAGRLVSTQSDEARDAYHVRKLAEHGVGLLRMVNARVPKVGAERESREQKMERAEQAGLEGPDLAMLEAYLEWQSASQSAGRKLSALRKAETRDLEALKEAVAENQELAAKFIAAGSAE